MSLTCPQEAAPLHLSPRLVRLTSIFYIDSMGITQVFRKNSRNQFNFAYSSQYNVLLFIYY